METGDWRMEWGVISGSTYAAYVSHGHRTKPCAYQQPEDFTPSPATAPNLTFLLVLCLTDTRMVKITISYAKPFGLHTTSTVLTHRIFACSSYCLSLRCYATLLASYFLPSECQRRSRFQRLLGLPAALCSRPSTLRFSFSLNAMHL